MGNHGNMENYRKSWKSMGKTWKVIENHGKPLGKTSSFFVIVSSTPAAQTGACCAGSCPSDRGGTLGRGNLPIRNGQKCRLMNWSTPTWPVQVLSVYIYVHIYILYYIIFYYIIYYIILYQLYIDKIVYTHTYVHAYSEWYFWAWLPLTPLTSAGLDGLFPEAECALLHHHRGLASIFLWDGALGSVGRCWKNPTATGDGRFECLQKKYCG